MTVAYFVVAGLCALAFLATGLNKIVKDTDALRESGITVVDDFSPQTITAIGALEVLGAVGLILPAATGVGAVLSPVSAVMLTVLMLCAIIVHLRKSESFLPAALFGVLAGLTAVLGFVAFT